MPGEPLERRSMSRDGLLLASTTTLLVSAAIYNRYPLTYWDTHSYLRAAGTLMPLPDRPIGYSLFIRATSLLRSLWPVVVVQAGLVSWLLWWTFRTITGSARRQQFVLVSLALTFLSALPWLSGQLMPDVFTGVLVLAVFLLLEEPDASRGRRALLGGAIALAVAAHLTHLWLGVALLGIHAASFRFTRERLRVRALLAPGAALALGLAGVAGYNLASTGNPAPASGQSAFVLGHLVDSGMAQRMLAEHCPDRDYLLCAYKDRLAMSGDDFLWGGYLPFNPWKSPEATEREAHRLLSDSLREHPFLHIEIATTYTLRALFTFETGEALDSEAVFLIAPQIARFVPEDVPRYAAARQQAGVLPVKLLRTVHTPIAFAAVAFNVILVLLRWFGTRRRSRTASGDVLEGAAGAAAQVPASGVRFVLSLSLLMVVNAALTANLSCVNNRYGVRIVWLMVFSMFAVAVSMLRTTAASESVAAPAQDS